MAGRLRGHSPEASAPECVRPNRHRSRLAIPPRIRNDRPQKDPLLPALPDAYSLGMSARLMRALGRFLPWVTEVVGQVGGALNGGRSADKYATKLYERPRDEYHP
jgi:hypothetical protein